MGAKADKAEDHHLRPCLVRPVFHRFHYIFIPEFPVSITDHWPVRDLCERKYIC